MARWVSGVVAALSVVTFLGFAACSGTSGGGGGALDGGAATGNGGTGGIAIGGSGGIGIGGTGNGGSGGAFIGDPKTCAEADVAKTYIGCDFWPTVVANNVWSTFDYAVVVANAGDTAAEVTIERNGSPVATGTVQPNGLEKFFLPWVTELKGPDADTCGSATPLSQSVRAPGGAYHLTTSVPVTVYQFNALEYKGQGGPPGKNWGSCPGNSPCATSGVPNGCFSFSNDASLLLPTTALTGNYRITGMKGWALANMGSYFAVTGTQDGTKVTALLSLGASIIGGSAINSGGPGSVVEFTINRGEVVEVVGSAVADLSGTLVQASAPVQVITGMPCTFIPQEIYPGCVDAFGQPSYCQACDHIEESVFPAETLGKHYFVVPPTGPTGNSPGHVVRLFGNKDGTNLQYPGGAPPGAPTTIGGGQVVDLGVVTQPFEILSDTNEFAVGMFQLGASLADPGQIAPNQKGDPAQSLATAVEQFRTKYIFLAPDDYDVSYVDVVMPSGTALVLDGAAVSAPTQPLSSNFVVARVPLSAGVAGAHVLTSDQPVGIQVMGYGAYTSYQYPGGLNLTLIAPPPPPIK